MGEFDDHDMIIRIDENVKEIKARCGVCHTKLEDSENRIAAVEGDIKAVRVQNSVWSALAVGVSAVVTAAGRWLK